MVCLADPLIQAFLDFRHLVGLVLIATGLAIPIPAGAQEAPFVRDVFAGINAQRTKQSLSRLGYSKTLEKTAQEIGRAHV